MNQITTFNFNSNELRVITDDNGEPWFIAQDICKILGYENHSRTINELCRDTGIRKRYIPELSNTYSMIDEGNLYRLVIKSNKPEAAPFESYVCDDVLPTIRKTGQYISKPVIEPLTPQLQIAKAAAEILNMSETSKIRMLEVIGKETGVSTAFLPKYTDEQAVQSLTELLRDNGVNLSAVKANVILNELGILQQLERKSSKGSVKKFWSITDLGAKFGKNETSPQNPRETQPLWYRSMFPELLGKMFEKNAA